MDHNTRLKRVVCAACILACLFVSRPVSASENVAADSTRQRSPTGAMLRSVVLPGWGQFHNRRVVKGSVLAAAEIASVAALFVEARKGTDPVTGLNRPNRQRLYTLTTLGIIFFSMVDAYVDAHLDMVDWGGVEVDPEARALRLNVGLRF